MDAKKAIERRLTVVGPETREQLTRHLTHYGEDEIHASLCELVREGRLSRYPTSLYVISERSLKVRQNGTQSLLRRVLAKVAR